MFTASAGISRSCSPTILYSFVATPIAESYAFPSAPPPSHIGLQNAPNLILKVGGVERVTSIGAGATGLNSGISILGNAGDDSSAGELNGVT